jgi:hypothetical protein
MIRSKTIFSALLCSVSAISLAHAAPSPVTDWHVAPVLSPGHQNLPYCALATSYPQAGVIVTHARNKHGTGTIALDFQNGAFERGQFYGVDISFDDMTRSFAAEARNNRLLVIDMAEDHPLYSALNAGQDLTIQVQNGGPSAILAGNSRPFFQLNYCVQALNDDAAADIIVQNPRVMPSFALQQPAPRRSETIVLRPPQPKQHPVEQVSAPVPVVKPVATSVAAPVAVPVATRTAQSAQTQDGDESRQLKSMLDQARQQTTEKPARQKLSGISSTDDIDPNTIAPLNRNARQSLLFDDPNAANHYAAPRLENLETKTKEQAQKATKPVQQTTGKASDKVKDVLEKQKSATQQAAPVMAAPAAVKTPVVPAAPVIATSTPAALPMPLPLPEDDKPVTARVDAAPQADTPRTFVTPVEVKDTSRTVLATDYAREQQTGIPAKPYQPQAKQADTKVADQKVSESKIVENKVAAAPASIQWDKPVVTAPSHSVEAPTPAVTTTQAPQTASAQTAPSIFSGQPAAIRSVAPIAKTNVAPAPVLAAQPATTAVATPVTAAVATTIEQPAPAKTTDQTKPKISAEKPIKPDDVLARAATPQNAPAVPVTTPAAPPVLAAPALPPAIIAEEQIAPPAPRQMARSSEPARSASHAVAVTFPEDEIEDISGDIGSAPAWSAEVAQNKPLAVPSALLQSKPTGATKFVPPASLAVTAWSVSTAGEREGGYCVIKNRFNNQQNLFVSRAVDGSTTLGIDYGMDLLQLNRDYKATIHVDHIFVEDFIGQARQENLLVVQMGRKDSFFDALRQGKELHVALEGGASTFDISGLNKAVPDFNTCLVQQGGSGLSARITQPQSPVMVAPAVAAPVASPVQAPAIAAPVAAVIPKASAPIATTAKPIATTSSLPAPRSGEAIRAAAGLSHMTTQAPAPVVAATQNVATSAPTPTSAPAPAKTEQAPISTSGLTPTKVNAILQRASIRANTFVERGQVAWGRADDLVRGQVSEQQFASGKEDVLEGAMRDIDAREKECGSSFNSEIGVPEQYGAVEIMTAEASCNRNGQTHIESSVYQRIGRLFRIWTLRSTASDRDMLISQRDRLASALQKD